MLEGEVLPAAAAPFFRLAHHDIRGSTAVGTGFAVGIAMGELVLETAHGGSLELRGGTHLRGAGGGRRAPRGR